jgi:hypothetical protein
MAAGAIADANANEIKCAIALLDSLEGLPATTVVLCMEGRAAWRFVFLLLGKIVESQSKKPWGGDLSVLELQQQKRAGDCDVSRGFGKVIGLVSVRQI